MSYDFFTDENGQFDSERWDHVRCKWGSRSEGTVQCALLGGLSEGQGRDFMCAFHHDCQTRGEEATMEGFNNWLINSRKFYASYPGSIWNEYTVDLLWSAVGNGVRLPQKAKGKTEATFEAAAPKDYAKRSMEYEKQRNFGKITVQQSVDMLHNEFGCPIGCHAHEAAKTPQGSAENPR